MNCSYIRNATKCFWLAEGDSNTKFFHAYPSARKKSDFVSRLRTDEGVVITNKDVMNGMAVDYF